MKWIRALHDAVTGELPRGLPLSLLLLYGWQETSLSANTDWWRLNSSYMDALFASSTYLLLFQYFGPTFVT